MYRRTDLLTVKVRPILFGIKIAGSEADAVNAERNSEQGLEIPLAK